MSKTITLNEIKKLEFLIKKKYINSKEIEMENSWKIINNKLVIIKGKKSGQIDQRFIQVKLIGVHLAAVYNGKFWGVINHARKLIVPMRYDIIEVSDSLDLLCGRDGEEFKGYGKNKSFQPLESFYTGVYDLYSLDGVLIFGGFDEFKYYSLSSENEDKKLYLFHIGRIIKIEDGFCERKYYDIDEKGKWIVFTTNYKGELVIPFKTCHEHRTFNGFSIKVFQDKIIRQWNNLDFYPSEVLSEKWINDDYFERVQTYNIPNSILFDDIKEITNNYLIVRDDKKCYRIDLNHWEISKAYDIIKPIDKEYSLCMTNYELGLLRFSKEIVNCKYDYITYPVNDQCFLFRMYPDFPGTPYHFKYYGLYLDLNNIHNFENDIYEQKPIIKAIDPTDIRRLLENNVFLLSKSVEHRNIKTIPIFIKDKFKKYFSKSIVNRTLVKPFIDHDEYIDYYENSWDLRERENYYTTYSYRYSYDDSLYDALDGEMDAYWNID